MTFLIILFALNGFAQTDTIQRIPGTRVCLIAPKEFRRVSHIGSFIHPSRDAYILVTEMASSFKEAAKDFDREKMQKNRVDVLLLDTIDFNGNKSPEVEIQNIGRRDRI